MAPSQPAVTSSFLLDNLHCVTCVSAIKDALQDLPGVRWVSPNVITSWVVVERDSDKRPSSRPSQDLDDTKSDCGVLTSARSVSTVDDAVSHKTPAVREWRVTMAIVGMSCAACSNTITEQLTKHEWITKVTINLISHSGTVEFVGAEEDANKIVESIEDTGFDAQIDQVTPINDGDENTKLERSVDIHIAGFYCHHCGERLTRSLKPIMKIKYVPDAPRFHIRKILEAIDATDPEFQPTIYHPPSLEEQSKRIHAAQQKRILYRVLTTLVIAVPTFIIGIVYMSLVPENDVGKKYLMMPWRSGISRAQIALFIMATPVYFFGADIFHRRAIKEIYRLWKPGSRTPLLQRFYRFGSMNMLISLGTTIAYVSSVSQLIAAGVQKPDSVPDTNFYFDSVVFLTLFLLIGRLIEAYTKSKTGDAVEALGKLRPDTAILVEKDADAKDTDSTVSTDLLDFGDIVRIPHGSSPPCDGTIIHGETNFDESSLTGESRPIKKRVGDEVYSGTINKHTPVLVRITGVAGRSMLDQIVNVVREGQTKRAPMEKIADTLTAYFVPVVTLIAVLTWLIWLIAGVSGAVPEDYLDVSSGGWAAFSLQFAIAVFVVACPCGLALAAPTAIFVGGGLAAKHGILVKGGGEAFERASHVDCVVFDKTGTLTMGGEPTITDSELVPGQDAGALYSTLRAVEENSSHPIAKAIVSFCQSNTSERASVTDVEEIAGRGLRSTRSSESADRSFDMIVGNEAMMEDFGVPIPPTISSSLQDWKTQAKSVALVATKPLRSSSTATGEGEEDSSLPVPGAFFRVVAALAIADPIRPETPRVIKALRDRGTDVWMLSGDNATTARAVALRVGIPADNVLAEVLPAQKYERVRYLQATLKARGGGNLGGDRRRATVAMVGDGINDAPALTTADVGVAVGSGSDVAISSAAFVLVHSNLAAVPALLDLSKAVFARVRLNFAWALVYNLLAVPVAAGCFYPIRTGGGGGGAAHNHVRLDPVWASLAMALSSISVVCSSLALRTGLPLVGFRPRVLLDVRDDDERGE
ncbi:copper transporting P-type ATPase [Xylariaceae sp. FL0804]|nr:copper transporting P-type ATPase [Xylariaceae sp. FL0804]